MERLFGLDAQLLFEVVLSMIAVFTLFVALSYILFDPVRDMLKKRQEMVQETKDTANKEKEDALKLKAEYDAKVKNAEAEAELFQPFDVPPDLCIGCDQHIHIFNVFGLTLSVVLAAGEHNGL